MNWPDGRARSSSTSASQRTEAREGDVGESQRLTGEVTPAVCEHPAHGKGESRPDCQQHDALPASNRWLFDTPRTETQVAVTGQPSGIFAHR